MKSQRRPPGTLPTRQLGSRSASLRRKRRRQAPPASRPVLSSVRRQSPAFQKISLQPTLSKNLFFSNKAEGGFALAGETAASPSPPRDSGGAAGDGPQRVLMLLLGESGSSPSGSAKSSMKAVIPLGPKGLKTHLLFPSLRVPQNNFSRWSETFEIVAFATQDRVYVCVCVEDWRCAKHSLETSA